MKIKILILTLGIIITMICGVKINDFNTANNVQDNKIVTADENLIAYGMKQKIINLLN